ncbi:MAG TPA: extracellular solute-binding protein, partial [Anaerolineae bacterium]|nr:extracellular solute-binding protein [Anaerolineae bacterium]
MHVHRIHLLAVMIVLGLMLGACALPAAPPPGAPPAPAGPKVEKELVVYAPHGPEITEPMVALFKQKYPDIKVDVITAGTGELMNRIRAEKDNPLGDLMWGGATELYEANADLFAPVELENDAATVVQDEKHIWHAADLLFQAIAVNTDLLSEEEYPKTFKELADPKWKEKGGLALANPRASGTGYSLVTAMVTLYGWDFMVELLKNATITEGSSAMFKMVRDGEVPVAFINEDLGL